jgi:hypothetical protein
MFVGFKNAIHDGSVTDAGDHARLVNRKPFTL